MVGEEKSRRSVLRYFKSFDPKSQERLVLLKKENDDLYVQKVKDGLDALKQGDWVIYDTSKKHFTDSNNEQKSNGKKNKPKLWDELKLAHSRATMLICIPSDNNYTDSELEWIRKFQVDLQNDYPNRYIVFTDCPCMCMRYKKIPKNINTTGTSMLHRLDDGGFGRLLWLKLTGNIEYPSLVQTLLYTIVALKCGSNQLEIFVNMLINVIQIAVYRKKKIQIKQFEKAFSRWGSPNFVTTKIRKASLADIYTPKK